MSATGIWPAAAAWSPNEEERRKALLSYFLEGVVYIIWDNIKRGEQISCPHIEKSCTAAYYTDRRLGVSEAVATSASSIHIFTGNNIGPRGDLASRALCVHLEVDRADPENRAFKHNDPVAWTEAHRGEILAALYTVLLGNPTLKAKRDAPMKTRFKMWWRVVGSAVEHAARQATEQHERPEGLEPEEHWEAAGTASAQEVDFKEIFLAQEEEDEESLGVGDALSALYAMFGDESFDAADVADVINARSDSFRLDALAVKWRVKQEDIPKWGRALREFLYPRAKADDFLSAKSIGMVLKRQTDNAVKAGGESLILKRSEDSHANRASFRIVRKA
jgi:hypothetical protein